MEITLKKRILKKISTERSAAIIQAEKISKIKL
jgi:hypothetical protein